MRHYFCVWPPVKTFLTRKGANYAKNCEAPKEFIGRIRVADLAKAAFPLPGNDKGKCLQSHLPSSRPLCLSEAGGYNSFSPAFPSFCRKVRKLSCQSCKSFQSNKKTLWELSILAVQYLCFFSIIRANLPLKLCLTRISLSASGSGR